MNNNESFTQNNIKRTSNDAGFLDIKFDFNNDEDGNNLKNYNKSNEDKISSENLLKPEGNTKINRVNSKEIVEGIYIYTYII